MSPLPAASRREWLGRLGLTLGAIVLALGALEIGLRLTHDGWIAVWPNFVLEARSVLAEREHGRIVNMASVAGTLGGFGQASYSVTKAGLLGLTRTLALEGARHGITCNAIVPGIIGTEAFNMGSPEMNERMVKRTAMRRAGAPQEIANAIAFLVSDLASYITGIELNVSGGIELFTF